MGVGAEHGWLSSLRLDGQHAVARQMSASRDDYLVQKGESADASFLMYLFIKQKKSSNFESSFRGQMRMGGEEVGEEGGGSRRWRTGRW